MIVERALIRHAHGARAHSMSLDFPCCYRDHRSRSYRGNPGAVSPALL